MRRIFVPVSIAILLILSASCGGSSTSTANPTTTTTTADPSAIDEASLPANGETPTDPSSTDPASISAAPTTGSGEFVIDAFEKSFSANEVQCSDIDGATYVYAIASANSTATLSWEGTSRANAYITWGLTAGDGYIPFPETFVVNIAEDGLSGTFTGDFILPDVANINRRPFSGTFECGS